MKKDTSVSLVNNVVVYRHCEPNGEAIFTTTGLPRRSAPRNDAVFSKFITALVGLALVGFLALVSRTQAQTLPPKLLITWRADGYAPADFSGKILPIANSRIAASFELLDRGRAVDVSREVVYWYVNGNLIKNEPGAQQVVFRIPQFSKPSIDLRVELPGYGGGLLKTMEIPVARPTAVVDAPFPNGILANRSATLRGIPYFFNVKSFLDLSFGWNVNGVAPESGGDPLLLTMRLPEGAVSGSAVRASLTIENPKNALEAGTGSATLRYVP